MHIHSRPTEQISTAHRYTSETHKHVHTHKSNCASASCLLLDSTQKSEGEKKAVHVLLSYLRRCTISFGLGYFCRPRTIQCQSTTSTHTLKHAKNMTTYLQTSSTGFLWPWWPVGRALHGERKRESREVCEVRSHHCGLPAAWLHAGWSLNKANCRKTTSLGRPPPCLILSLNHCPEGSALTFTGWKRINSLLTQTLMQTVGYAS